VGKYKPEDIDPSLCTHINYGFAVLDPVRYSNGPITMLEVSRPHRYSE
jgi:GH18 family chitinase